MAVKTENDTASNAKKIRKTIVAGGDHVAQAAERTRIERWNDDVDALLTGPIRLDARAHMETENAQRIEGYHTRVELEQKSG